ncbi:MAG: hypothetical protein WC389_17400 [Lutibacter sp.]|jgi:hypothetical protein
MKKYVLSLSVCIIAIMLMAASCENETSKNKTAIKEQVETEINQTNLLAIQPPPKISWSLERDNLIKRFRLQNDRSVMFYMYVFIEGVADPIGYYQVNKVSSVNSQLTNTEQIIDDPNGSYEAGSVVLPSPAEDGSYGTNGDGVFGFTPEDIYIEHNMKYIVATVPLSFTKPVNRLTVINVQTEKQLKEMMNRINSMK